jgi:hypothetical protein
MVIVHKKFPYEDIKLKSVLVVFYENLIIILSVFVELRNLYQSPVQPHHEPGDSALHFSNIQSNTTYILPYISGLCSGLFLLVALFTILC